MTTYQVGLLQGKELEKWWPNICESIDMSPPSWVKRMPRDMLLEMAESGDLMVWGVGIEKSLDILMLSRIIQLEEKVMIIEFISGRNLDKLLPAIDAAVEFCAQQYGCAEIIVKGRAGWKAKLKPLGFRLHSVELSRPVRRTRH